MILKKTLSLLTFLGMIFFSGYALQAMEEKEVPSFQKDPLACASEWSAHKRKRRTPCREVSLDEPEDQGKVIIATGLEENREFLAKAFDHAQKRLVILSPWLTEEAMLADNLPHLIVKASLRKVPVIVYTDSVLGLEKGVLRDDKIGRRGEPIDYCVDAVMWRIVDKIHAKVIMVDDDIFINGSFNWLSASRDSQSSYSRYDVSTWIEGKVARSLIEKMEQDLRRLEGETLDNAFNTIRKGYWQIFKGEKEADLKEPPVYGQDLHHLSASWALKELLRGGHPGRTRRGFTLANYQLKERNAEILIEKFRSYLKSLKNKSFLKAFEEEVGAYEDFLAEV